LYAGVVAVLAYPPKGHQKMTGLQAIVSDAGAKVALSTGALLKNIENRFALREDLTSQTGERGSFCAREIWDFCKMESCW